MSSLTLHDCLSLGEIELGLDPERNDNDDGKQKRIQEIQRLPLFLRILSLTRPLASISMLGNDDSDGENKDSTKEDALINRTVERLEHVAATYSVAEGVDVVTSYLAPTMSREISRLPPLKRNKNGVWDTTALAEVARNPRSWKRKRPDGDIAADAGEDEKDHNIHEASSSDDDHDQTAEEKSNKRPRHDGNRRDSEVVAAEDSQEATFLKTLAELTSLVVGALAPLEMDNTNTEGNDNADDQSNRTISLTIDDSILNESGSSAGTGGAMEGSDLGSTVAAIMFNASVLQSRHVAYALCRAATPQAGDLMTRLGANCPASIPSLLLGCLDAYTLAMQHSNTPITKAAKQAVLALAKLSPNERGRVLNKLQSLHLMVDIQLTLRLELPDATSTACFLLQHLSKEVVKTSKPVERSKKSASKQTSGETSGDIRATQSLQSGSHQTVVQSLLADNMVLYKKTLAFFTTEFTKLADATQLIANGKLCLLLKAYCWLLLVPATKTSSDQLQAYVEQVSPALIRFATCVHNFCEQQNAQEEGIPETSAFDGIVTLTRSGLVLTMARIWAEIQIHGHALHGATDYASRALNEIRNLAPISKRASDFCSRIDAIIKAGNSFGFLSIVVTEITVGKSWEEWQLQECFSSIERGLKLFFEHYAEGQSSLVETPLDLESSAAALLLEIQYGDDSTRPWTADKISKLKATLQSILVNSKSPGNLVRNDQVLKFIVAATVWLATHDEIPVPYTSPPRLEMLATKLSFNAASESMNEAESTFLLLLLHSFEYLQQNPKSPFGVDPRALPVKEALNLSKALSSQTGSCYMLSKLEEYARLFCPEIYIQAQTARMLRDHSKPVDAVGLSLVSRTEMMKLLSASIRSCVQNSRLDDNDDRDAMGPEALFLEANRRLSHSDLCCAVASALLASPHKPPQPFTFHSLCRDPLVLLKCPLRAWKCKGLRRIILTVLSSLMESNDAIVKDVAPSEETAEEFLAARDALIVRCLVTAMSGSLESKSAPVEYCGTTTSILRFIVCKRRGIVALLVKQGLPENALDWLVEFVPETMNDSQDMLQMLSDRRALTPAERLVAADAVLRIAIVHGHANETDAASMAYVALSQLVDNFFLIAGPVGVPVNALLVGDSGLDVTQISRNAAFRILKSMRQVRRRRTNLSKECGMALHKLAALCKSESAVSGVAGAVAGRRNTLLKEIFDAVTKAANSMGSPLRNQSSAA